MSDDWRADALCAQVDPELFFPLKGGNTGDAKKICAACDVPDQCLTWALANGVRGGIYGGMSDRERCKHPGFRAAAPEPDPAEDRAPAAEGVAA